MFKDKNGKQIKNGDTVLFKGQQFHIVEKNGAYFHEINGNLYPVTNRQMERVFGKGEVI